MYFITRWLNRCGLDSRVLSSNCFLFSFTPTSYHSSSSLHDGHDYYPFGSHRDRLSSQPCRFRQYHFADRAEAVEARFPVQCDVRWYVARDSFDPPPRYQIAFTGPD